MDVPLNIDWQQILLHLFNFAILAFGLYLLLYKPVKKFMEKRTLHYAQVEAEVQEKLASAAALEESRKKQLMEADAEINQEKTKAAKETEEQVAAELQRAKEQAEKILSDAKVSAEAERKRIVASAGKEIAELASAATEKLLKEAMSRE